MFLDRSHVLLVMLLFGAGLRAQAAQEDADDVADIRSQDLLAGGDANQRYFLIGPAAGAKVPAKGFALVVILPGGHGGADFHPFVKRIYKNALKDDYLVAQPVAVKWTGEQQIVWPTAKNREKDMEVLHGGICGRSDPGRRQKTSAGPAAGLHPGMVIERTGRLCSLLNQ